MHVDQQRIKLNNLVDEKLEQVSIIEINIKERIKELSKAERALKKERK
jgi:DNA-binding transcriptional regulator LsrR (DeoR family)